MFWHAIVLMMFCTVQSRSGKVRGGRGEMNGTRTLQFVQVVIQSWNSFLETLALACISHDLRRLAAGLHGISRKDLPVIEYTLWEGLTRSVGTKVSGETYGKKIRNYTQHSIKLNGGGGPHQKQTMARFYLPNDSLTGR